MKNTTKNTDVRTGVKTNHTRYQAMVNAFPDLLIEMDREGNILDYSASDRSLLHTLPEQFMSKNITDILPPAIADDAIAHCRGVLESKEMTSFEYELSMANGQRIFEARIMPLTENSSLFVIREITVHKQTEIERQPLLNVLEVSLNEIYMFDPDTLRFQYVNQGAIRNLGYSLEQLKAMTPIDIKPEFTEESFRELIEPMLQHEQEKYIFQTVHQRSDNSLYPVEVHLQLVKNPDGYVFLAVILDITERKHTEQKLRESEERYRSLFEEAPIGILLADRHGQILEVNPTAIQILGSPSAEATRGINMLTFPLLVKAGISADFQKAIETGQSAAAEYPYTTKWGKAVYIFIRFTPLFDALGNIVKVQIAFEDITERKQAEEKLRDSEERFRTFIEQSTDGFMLSDEQGSIIEWNHALSQINGLPREQALGRSMWDIQYQMAAPEMQTILSLEQLKNALQTMLTGVSPLFGQVKDIEIQTVQGERRIIQQTAFPIQTAQGYRIGAVVRDVTKRKQIESALQESEERYRQMFETNQAVKLIIDPSDGRIVEANQAAVRFYGYDYATLTQMKISDINTLSEEAVHREMKKARGQERLYFNFRHRLASGEIRDVEVYSGPIHTTQGDLLYSIIHDITERKRTEAIIMARIRLLDYAASHSLDEMLKAALDEAELLTNSVIGFFHFLNEDQNTVALHAWSTSTVKDFCKADSKGLHYPVSEAGVWVDCIRERRPMIHNDYASLSHRKGLPEGHATVIRELVVPIIRGNRIVAILGVGNKPTDYTTSDVDTISRFADLTWDITERVQTENALQESEQRWQFALEGAGDGVWDWDAQTNKVFFSQQWKTMLGFAADEIGDTLDEWEKRVHPDDKQIVQAEIDRHFAAQTPNYISEHRVRCKDGSYKWILDRGKVIEWASDGKPIRVIGTHTDITERKQAEKQIRQQLMRLNGLHTIDIAISSSFELKATLDIVLKQAMSILSIDACAVLLYNTHSQILEYASSRGFHSNAIQHTKLRIGSGFAGRVVVERKTIHITDLLETGGTLSESLKGSKEEFTDYYGTPLIVKGEVKGVLEIYHRTRINPDADWLAFLETLATQTAIAIDNTQLFERLQRSNFDLVLAYDATIEGWSRALDLRDKETEGHTQRVTNLTVKLAQQMGITDADIVHIRRGALLHDIGKMGIPDRILLKPDKLDAEEWAIMRKHTLYANNMLSPIAYLKPALDIPLYHHEYWDGNGYPYQLQGEQIPLPARIFTVVDVWDAVTSDRPYRPAWSKEEAVKYIRDQSGKQFDPQVVDAFLKMINLG